MEKFVKLRFVFKKDGIVIVGNVLGINDGVVMLVVMVKEKVEELGIEFFVIIVFYGIVGVDFKIMGYGLVLVIKKVLEVVNMIIEDIDLVEVNEVFVV